MSKWLCLTLVVILSACGGEVPAEPNARAHNSPTLQASADIIKDLDARIASDAYASLAQRVTKPRLSADRRSDVETLAPWAARAAASGMCRTVNSIRLSPDATNEQLAWSVSCDSSLGITISEKGALQLRQKLAGTQFADDGSRLPDMFAKGGPSSQALDAVGAMINLNRQLCGKVVNVAPLQVRDNVYEVTCVEFRGGSGQVRYLLDMNTGTSSKL